MEIKVGAIVYQVEIVDDLRDGDQKLSGWIRHTDSLILLEAALSSQMGRHVLWHEIIHSIFEQAGIDDQDERIIQVLAYGIMGVLKDNPCLREIDHDDDIERLAMALGA